MKHEGLTKAAHRQGLILMAMPDATKSTVMAVGRGVDCALALSDDRDIKRTAASNRLARAARMNLIELCEVVGVAKFYQLTKYGKSMPWVK